MKPVISSIREIFRTSHVSPAFRTSRHARFHWWRLPEEHLALLLGELNRREQGRFVHHVNPATRFVLADRLQEFTHIDQAYESMRHQRTPWENRFLDEAEATHGPCPSRWKHRAGKTMVLPDGRRAQPLDPEGRRALPLCGVRTPVVVADIPARSQKGTWRTCPRCRGFHVPVTRFKKPFPPATTSPVDDGQSQETWAPENQIVACPKCSAEILDLEWSPMPILHCYLCGWRKELPVSLLSEAEIRANADIVEQAPVRCIDESEDIREEEESGFELFGEENQQGTDLLTDLLNDPEEASSEEILLTRLNQLWSRRTLQALRNALIEVSLSGTLASERINLLWAVTLIFLDACTELSAHDQKQWVHCLLKLDSVQLEDYLAEWWNPDQETLPDILPDVQPKLTRWKQACSRCLSRFRYREAGIRVLAPKFHVSEEVFARACA